MHPVENPMPNPHIFISYPQSEQTYAEQVADHLRQQGFDVWINDGKRWWLTISRAIMDCGAVVVISGSNADDRQTIQQEVELAQTLEHPILTIHRGDESPEYLSDFDATNGNLPDTAFCERLKDYITHTIIESPVVISEALDEESLEEEDTDVDPVAEQPPTPHLAAALTESIEGVMRNADWQPVSRVINGIDMLLVPPGCFMMGNPEHAAPVQTRCIERPFWISRHPITTGQYLEAVRQHVCAISRWAGDFHFNDPQQPIVGIGWQDALKFARWKHMRLPTETEWEYVARGPEGWAFPWGHDLIAENFVHADNANQRTAPISTHPQGVSWVGAHDLCGNVWEWCLSVWRADYSGVENNQVNTPTERRVLRGGSFLDSPNQIAATRRTNDDPIFGNVNIGFRLVCMAPQI